MVNKQDKESKKSNILCIKSPDGCFFPLPVQKIAYNQSRIVFDRILQKYLTNQMFQYIVSEYILKATV